MTFGEGGSVAEEQDQPRVVDAEPQTEAPNPGQAKEMLEKALFEIRRVIAGQDAMLERVLVCLLCPRKSSLVHTVVDAVINDRIDGVDLLAQLYRVEVERGIAISVELAV